MRLGSEGGDSPPWAAIGAIAAGVLILGVIVWRTMFVSPLSAGPPKAVHPGMYDLRAEVAKMRAAQGGASGQTAGQGTPGAAPPPVPGTAPPPVPGTVPPSPSAPGRDPSGF